MMTSKWQHFKALSFLKEIVRPRQTSGNCSAIADLEATEDAHSLEDALEEYGEEVVLSKGDNEADHVENNANENVTEGTSDHATTRGILPLPRLNKWERKMYEDLTNIRLIESNVKDLKTISLQY